VSERALIDVLGELERRLGIEESLEALASLFQLTPFERSLALLCAGVEMDAELAAWCEGRSGAPSPTFGLALAELPGAHWSALSPARPLRRWDLVLVETGATLTRSRLQLDERVLHFAAGVAYMDARLEGLVRPHIASDSLTPGHRQLADRAASWLAAERSAGRWSALVLSGQVGQSKWDVAAAAAGAAGWTLHVLGLDALPEDRRELGRLRRLWERESILGSAALLVDCEQGELSEPRRRAALVAFADGLQAPLLLAAEDPPGLLPQALRIEVPPARPPERRGIWAAELAPREAELNGRLDAVVAQFALDPADIRATARELLASGDGGPLGDRLWDACRVRSRPRLDDLAQRVETSASWSDLILPEPQLAALRQVAAQVRRRSTVYEDWGFARRSRRGLGISALFAGQSGTGKTLAAEVLANELELDLYRVDLSSVVSKYIGETEKNLRRVFDAADCGGAVLLFDEADALFGKRTEVSDSHDRFANIEISYLLQRMEAYEGLAILTTNMRSALDDAFLRRLRFVIEFPFPDAAQRAEIWRRVFPPEAPTEGIDERRLATMDIAGGNIRNVALGAAFLAADAGVPVGMQEVTSAAVTEYAKLDRSFTLEALA
jgi:hypothetical protein